MLENEVHDGEHFRGASRITYPKCPLQRIMMMARQVDPKA
jgi:hypothetical protein